MFSSPKLTHYLFSSFFWTQCCFFFFFYAYPCPPLSFTLINTDTLKLSSLWRVRSIPWHHKVPLLILYVDDIQKGEDFFLLLLHIQEEAQAFKCEGSLEIPFCGIPSGFIVECLSLWLWLPTPNHPPPPEPQDCEFPNLLARDKSRIDVVKTSMTTLRKIKRKVIDWAPKHFAKQAQGSSSGREWYLEKGYDSLGDSNDA